MKKGLDAPLVPLLLISFGLVALVAALSSHELINLIFPLILLVSGGLYLYTSLVGKYKIIVRVVSQMDLQPNAQVLDLGTGHGAFLMEIAKKLKAPGKVTGIDIWNQNDQLNNALANTQQLIDAQDLTGVSQLTTANMTDLPFNDETFNFVVASVAIHNVKPASARAKAISEAYRVLKPGGEIIIIDIEHIAQYQRTLQQLGVSELTVSNAGINGMYGIMMTRILRARK
ncbi:class I SAM-dependent methyltransferase [Lactobacillus sp. LC28-10]|uniref:Class I SAM-dependent methyltransferase n=1 Tax=Secundilactobacillus angelensis TaxID=2722706 RepID=A0ABX1L0Y2_9LACO|nr:class I SAM-dependent methyltransferase [Secundilactobacillus angelensis]MCH5462628.1 class I SAM-dependent methyltransferase [Secundilactobacillus angelensis]NLR19120.1 class I SAM-dependent methyltransferase [Secundilactobacillus angelensis]